MMTYELLDVILMIGRIITFNSADVEFKHVRANVTHVILAKRYYNKNVIIPFFSCSHPICSDYIIAHISATQYILIF